MMETEACVKCGIEVQAGVLVRDSVDAALLYCEKCRPKKPRKPRKRKEVPVIAPAAIIYETDRVLETPVSIDPAALQQDAVKWAQECGLKNATAKGPSREDFPRYGFGYVFQVMEVGGKERKATARYTSRGERSFWTIDGMAT